MELPVFGDKKQKALNQQREKKVLKPIRRTDKSATRQQQCKFTVISKYFKFIIFVDDQQVFLKILSIRIGGLGRVGI